MNPATESSFLNIILQGGNLSLAILFVLLIMSVLSWAVIGWKWVTFKTGMKKANDYLAKLNLTDSLSDAQARSETFASTYFAKEFQAAIKEYLLARKSLKQAYITGEKQDFLLRVERSIEKCIVQETMHYDKLLIVLATISSSAPFIGLFGTVTGIIDAFYAIGAKGAASIAVVAPGISAALVATAFGLFAAIPALMAYNVFRNKSSIVRQEMEAFGFDLINLFDSEFSKAVTLTAAAKRKTSTIKRSTDRAEKTIGKTAANK
jgi:biopolymer transport protein TolQ